MEPVKFGKFLIVDKIAQGGMAEIYKAKVHTGDGAIRTVAIKKILSEYSRNEDFITLLTDEAKLMVTLNHPNIVPVIEFGSVDKDYYLALEYVRGKNLKELLLKLESNNSSIPFEVCAYVIREICQGLDYAHRKKDSSGNDLKIIHRDISPTNVLLSYGGEVKIVDFGISKAASHSHVTQTGIIRGKMGYMSPEQTKSYLDIDCRSDVYSAGILLYEMITNKRLFPAENINDAIKSVRKGIIPKPSSCRESIPLLLERIILRSLQYDVEERIQSAAIMRDELNEFLAGSAIKNNYSRIFSSGEFALYMQNIFKDEYDKEVDKLDFDARESSGSARFLFGRKFRTSKQQTEHSKSFVTNSEFREIDGSNIGVEHRENGIKKRGEHYKRHSAKEYFKAIIEERIVKIIILMTAILALAILITEHFLKPNIIDLTGGVYNGRRNFENRIITEPSGATVFVNSMKVQGETPLVNLPMSFDRLNIVEARKDGFISKIISFTPLNEVQNVINLRLEKKDIKKGSLLVLSDPPGAKVFLNGRETGNTTPFLFDDIAMTSHVITLRLDGFKTLISSFNMADKPFEYVRYILLKDNS